MLNKIYKINIIFFIFALYFFYSSAGILLSPFEYDEIYYLYDSWITYKGVDFRPNAFTPLRFFLSNIWHIIDGNVSNSWIFKCFIFLLLFIQLYFIYNSITIIIKNYKYKFFFSISISLFILSFSIFFRGFEIRPEVIGNTSLILLTNYLIRLTNRVNITTYGTFFVLFFACLGIAFSIRHIIPILLLISSFFIILFLIKKNHTINILLLIIFLIINLFFNFFIYDFFLYIKLSKSYQSTREAFTYFHRLTTGSSPEYLFCLLFLISSSVLLLLIFIRKIFKFDLILGPLSALLSLIYFYLFLLFFDIRPFEYIRSIEWTISVIILLFIFNYASYIRFNNLKEHSKIILLLICVFISLLIASFLVYSLHSNKKNSSLIIKSLFYSKDYSTLNSLTDSELISTTINSTSFFDQIHWRGIYCSRYPNDLALVDSWKFHPICIKDKGSLYLSQFENDDQFLNHLNTLNYRYISLFKESALSLNSDLNLYLYFYKINSTGTNYIYIKKN